LELEVSEVTQLLFISVLLMKIYVCIMTCTE